MARYNVHCLELFGSAANGKFDAAISDLDFLVEFEPLAPVDPRMPILDCSLRCRICLSATLISWRLGRSAICTSSSASTNSGRCCMPPEVLKFLHDIEQACGLDNHLTSGEGCTTGNLRR